MTDLNEQILKGFVEACDLSKVESKAELLERLTENESLGKFSKSLNRRNEAPTFFSGSAPSTGYNNDHSLG
ncbi:hypothetical protein L3V82_09695 [Thiotrichales bacterium 19S3-7]|nr:hypothetical protein [Thiotrichales bacterium 19S3-7]MCF6802431.1 hypothetical protein [Thiotrichales bacterium 19S3-11]